MTIGTPGGEGEETESAVLAALSGLRDTPMGTLIYEQIRHLVEEQDAAQRGIDRAYTMLLRILLDAYAHSPTLERINQLNHKLLELRHLDAVSGPRMIGAPVAADVVPAAEPAPPPVADVPGKRPTASIDADLDLNSVLEQLLHGLPQAPSQPDVGTPVIAGDAPVSTPASEIEALPEEANKTTAGPELGVAPAGQVERRVNSAYRLHLDRKRDEIAKLQEAFSQNVTDAITQNREFGALLQIELNALKQADSAQEIETLRQILIGGIEELISGQRALGSKLHRTNDYLSLIKSDSDRLRDELNKVRLLSLTDEFTGLPNRRAFMRRFQDEIGRAQRYGFPLALALIDLDEFKAVNDVHGHAAGDEVLRSYATNVLSILRHHDLVARYGGEEFAVLLPNTALEGAVAALNKVKHRAQTVSCTFNDKTIRIPTFSAGVTMYVPGDPYTALIDRADRALYRAKRLGRNRVEVEHVGEGLAPPPTAGEARS